MPANENHDGRDDGHVSDGGRDDGQVNNGGRDDGHVSDEDLRRTAQAITALAELGSQRQGRDSGRLLVEAARDFFGGPTDALASVATTVPSSEHPNIQIALDHLVEGDDSSELLGLDMEYTHHTGFSFATALSASSDSMFGARPSVVRAPRIDLPIDVDKELSCVVIGLWLLHDDDGDPVALGLMRKSEHGPWDPGIALEALAHSEEKAAALLRRVRDLALANNVFRGKILMFTSSRHGEPKLGFMARPTVERSQVILEEKALQAIERQTLAFARQSAALVAAGIDLRRGMLLYGPPGTGKTHTISYLMAQMPERTIVALQGAAVFALSQAVAIIRDLQPAMLVIEDVDLVAEARGYSPMGDNPLLFELLNEMDGLNSANDVIFVLTTNRVEVLEPAIASRPGRIDVAVEIGLPDEDARRQLLDLYLGADTAIGDYRPILAATDGAPASLLKELARRARFIALEDFDGAPVNDVIVAQAAEELAEFSVRPDPTRRGGPPMGPPPGW